MWRAGEAIAFLFEQYFTKRLLADPRYKKKVLNSNKGGGGGWRRECTRHCNRASDLSAASCLFSAARSSTPKHDSRISEGRNKLEGERGKQELLLLRGSWHMGLEPT
jgi:hypothetical protein